MNKNFLHNKTKLIFQSAILILILVLVILGAFHVIKPDYEAYCPFGGILSLGSKLWLGSMSCAMSEVQVFMGIFLLIGVMVFGKLFCGYICPIGTVIEWLNKLLAKFKLSHVLTGIWDRLLRIGKYVLLFFTAYFTITSSELWCKKFDPYYAATSGFDSDVVVWAGILTLLVVVIGSVYIRFFWCKYVCPLGAVSNIFANYLITLPIIILYIIIRLIGWDLHILWLLLALVISGAATEIIRFKFYSVSPLRVKVNKDNCISCSLCDKSCPQGIEVSKYEKVTHPDCNFCMDCVKSCKTDNSIGLIKSNGTWLPPVVLVVLFVLGLIFAKTFSFTTLSERWGNFDELETVGKYEMKDVRSIKCWGSAKTLQNKLMKKKGIVGLDAWAKSHRIVVYYDPEKTDVTGVKKAVFKPVRYKMNTLKGFQPEQLAVFQISIDGIWDTYDNIDLVRMLMKNKNIYGYETNFGEPVIAKILFNADSIQTDVIKEIIEQKSYIRKSKGKEETVEVDFECADKGTVIDTVSYIAFRQDFFSGYNQTYNDYENYNPDSLYIFEIGLPYAESTGIRQNLKYLTSHISFFEGAVRTRTTYTDRPVLQVYYDPAQVDSARIHQSLLEPVLKIYVSDDETKERKNLFEFEDPARVIKY